MPIYGVLKHFVEDFKLQFIEKTGMNIKARFTLWVLNINVSLTQVQPALVKSEIKSGVFANKFSKF